MKTDTLDFDGYKIRIYTQGAGPALLLIHGIGPGTSIPANFSAVTDRLAESHSIIGFDLIGFGESSRKIEEPFFDFPLWERQAAHVAAWVHEGHDKAPLRVWGQSLGGALALRLAATLDFIGPVVVTGTGGGEHRLNAALDKFWTFPRSTEQLKDALLSSMLDPADVTDELVAGRYATLLKGDIGPYFEKMMAGDKQALLDSARAEPELLARITSPLLVIHGRDDRPCPYESSALYVLKHVKRCDAVLLGQCGHNPAREHPEHTVALALDHFAAHS